MEKAPESIEKMFSPPEPSAADPDEDIATTEKPVVEEIPSKALDEASDEHKVEETSVPKTSSIRLGAFLVLAEVKTLSGLLGVPLNEVTALAIDEKLKVDGVIYVKNKPVEIKRAPWAGYLDSIHGSKVDGLETVSSSAIVIIKLDKAFVIFSFGYGRYIINEEYLVPDFGIKTALNTLDHNTLRAVDLFSLEQSPIQRRSQATKNASINDFGIDVSRDVLKGVTGEAIEGVVWSAISGGGSQYSFTAKITDYCELVDIAKSLVENYWVDRYEKNFAWVDNIQRIKNSATIASLNDELIKQVKSKNSKSVNLSLPDISEWSSIFGFSYTGAKNEFKPSPNIEDYYSCNDVSEITLERLKQHRLYYSLINGEEFSFPLFNCIYFECIYKEKLHILFMKQWFTIDQDYVKRVDVAVKLVPLSPIKFPNVKLVEKKKKPKSRKKDLDSGAGSEDAEEDSTTLESEGDYNTRVAEELSFVLLDKKLVKSNSSASPVEVCDMLSPAKEFIHAKHRKGNSSGLSHLFAQGRVAAELLLSDKDFRKNARAHLTATLRELIPLSNFRPKSSEIVFLVLGVSTENVVQSLPFFSKINLISAFRSLSERQFRVSIAGAEVDGPPAAE